MTATTDALRAWHWLFDHAVPDPKEPVNPIEWMTNFQTIRAALTAPAAKEGQYHVSESDTDAPTVLDHDGHCVAVFRWNDGILFAQMFADMLNAAPTLAAPTLAALTAPAQPVGYVQEWDDGSLGSVRFDTPPSGCEDTGERYIAVFRDPPPPSPWRAVADGLADVGNKINEHLPVFHDPDDTPEDEVELSLTWREIRQLREALAAYAAAKEAGG